MVALRRYLFPSSSLPSFIPPCLPPFITTVEVQYLLVGGAKSPEEKHVLLDKEVAHPGSIQIWAVPGMGKGGWSTEQGQPPKPTLSMCLLHDHGSVFQAQWCPYPVYQSPSPPSSPSSEQHEQSEPQQQPPHLSCLGVVAVVFGDGRLRVYAVPHPEAVRQRHGQSLPAADPVLYWKPSAPMWSSSAAATPNDAKILTVAWTRTDTPHGRLAAGCSDGSVMVWDVLEDVFRGGEPASAPSSSSSSSLHPQQQRAPTVLGEAHAAAVRALSWYPATTGSGITNKVNQSLASSGNDGRVVLWDLSSLPSTSTSASRLSSSSYTSLSTSSSSPPATASTHILPRSLGFKTGVQWASQPFDAVLFTDVDGTVRWSLNDDLRRISCAVYHQAHVWNLDSTPHHEFVASCSADGTLQITNPHRSMFRGHRNIQWTLYQLERERAMSSTSSSASSASQSSSSSSSSTSTPPTTVSLKYRDHMPPVEYEGTKSDQCFPRGIDLVCGVHCVRWNPNPALVTWLASGGRAGIVRVECILGSAYSPDERVRKRKVGAVVRQ